MNLYDFLNKTQSVGCLTCPFTKECDKDGAGYTEMDEYGTCPVNNINFESDIPIDFPENLK